MDIHVTIDSNANVNTYGGDFYDSDSDHQFDDFGIQIDEVTISGFTRAQFIKLLEEMESHLFPLGRPCNKCTKH